jgi:2-polyprenyl-3-methyl-5-hydroxy-6-metoxy-1,4-benzoquinol methylase
MRYREKLYSTYVSDNTGHNYGESSIRAVENQFPVWKKYYGRFLPDDRAAHVLELGCGDGGFVHYLRSTGYKNSHGIDRSPEQIKAAEGLGIKGVECADIVDFLRDKKDRYDAIVARDVLEHFNKDEVMDLLGLIFSSLKPGGVLLIQTPNGESPFGTKFRYWDFTHEVIFTSNSLNHVLRATGFASVAFYPAGPVPHGLKSTVRFLLWKAIELLLKFYMVVETGGGRGIYTQNIIAVARK